MSYRRGKLYKGQEPFRIDSVSYVKVQDKIVCNRINMYVKTSKTRQFNSKMTTLIGRSNPYPYQVSTFYTLWFLRYGPGQEFKGQGHYAKVNPGQEYCFYFPLDAMGERKAHTA